ncbi:uncharacterized protein LOC114300404 [Camellia sinensis]|uniref:uncharacterized protein LOC114300404 n=1 Tax=Camellia sinensis TaxID=4442 RepID=UPI00103639ED|nr:uncharacterized protein LOC114300404 [Camellia sinensis]
MLPRLNCNNCLPISFVLAQGGCILFDKSYQIQSLVGSEVTIGVGTMTNADVGCILFALVGELYYLLWWKRRFTNRRGIADHHYTHHAKELSYLLFFWKKPNCLGTRKTDQQVTNSVTDPDANNGHEPDLELGSTKDLLRKGIGEKTVESELMRLHNLCGPPRFFFTINEETKEDLEADDVKSRGDRSRKGSRNKSLSDLLVAVETSILTPLASPTLKPHNHPLDSYSQHGFNFNPLFESSIDVEMNKLRSSPPPKFKFLRDAEEKLMRRLMEEAEKRSFNVQEFVATEEGDGSFIRIIIGGKNRERELNQQIPQYHSNVSQVLPLASSPSTTFRSLDNNKPIQQ